MKDILSTALNWFKENYAVAIVIALLSFILLIVFKIRSDYVSTPGVIIRSDTTIITKYETAAADTVVKWYDRIIYSHPPADTVYIQKVDSVFIQQTRWKDVMLSVKKSKDKLTVFAINEYDSLLKEYSFSNIGNSFTALSTYHNVLVESSDFEWTGLNLSLSALVSPDQLSTNNYQLSTNNYQLSTDNYQLLTQIESGLQYKSRITLSALAQYDLRTAVPSLGLKLSYKLIK